MSDRVRSSDQRGQPLGNREQARPLGVRPEVTLTEAQRQTLQRLQDFDLSPVRERLLHDAVMPPGWVDDAILEFRRYLGLRVLATGTLDMFSKPIDAVWHTCLLFSRLYADYCQAAFGQFVHHEPARHDPSVPQPEREAGRVERWERFQAAYEGAYGPLPRLWQLADPRRS